MCKALISLLLFTLISFAESSSYYFYVWTGVADRNGSDFLATYSATLDDDTVTTKFIGTTPVGTSFNEPHHINRNSGQNKLVGTGLFSFLSGNNQVFEFDLTKKNAPVLSKTFNPALGGAADDAIFLPNGNILAAMMSDKTGAGPGKIAVIDTAGNIKTFPPTDPDQDFHPHGFAISDQVPDYFVSTDFLVPASVLTTTPVFKNSIRVWNKNTFELQKTIQLIDSKTKKVYAGSLDVRLIQGPPGHQKVYVTAMATGDLVLVDLKKGTVQSVLNFGAGSAPNILLFFNKGKNAVISLNFNNAIALLDTKNPEKPKIISQLKFPAGTGPHWLNISPDEQLLFASDYFLQTQPNIQGGLNIPCDRKVHIIKLSEDGLKELSTIDFANNPNFRPANPHSIASVMA